MLLSLINSTSKKAAAIISYLFLALNSVSSIILTPILLNFLGVEEYGLYQMIYSIGLYILILDLGIGSVMIRYISEYRARKDLEGMKQFAGMMALLTLSLCIIVFIVGVIFNYFVQDIFCNLTPEQYTKSHWMITLMTFQFVMTFIDHYCQGAINAYERFVFSKILGIIKVISVFGLTILFVYIGLGAVGIVLANTIIITLLTIVNIIYMFREIKFRIVFTRWKKKILFPIFGLMLAMLLQSVVANVNSSVDKTILGIMCTPTDVAIYSIAATIITLFNTLPSVLSSLFQPQVMKMVVKGTTPKQLTNLVIRVGRWQFIVCGAFLIGLLLFGMDFLNLWVGRTISENELRFSLIIMLIILPFNMIPLIQTVCISILNAYNKILYRSLILIIISVLHVIITIIIVMFWGPIGSPIGTAISYFLGYAILLNIYYYRAFRLEVFRMFKEILVRFSCCFLLILFLCTPLHYLETYSWIGFIGKITVYCSLLVLILYFLGLNYEEKSIINKLFFRKTSTTEIE